MTSYQETVSKFLHALNVDLIKEVKYDEKYTGYFHCICGQPINRAYKFINLRNHKECFVGKSCLQYVTDYLGWNDKR